MIDEQFEQSATGSGSGQHQQLVREVEHTVAGVLLIEPVDDRGQCGSVPVQEHSCCGHRHPCYDASGSSWPRRLG